MKKLLFVAAFAAAGFVGHAQTTFGVKGGVNISNFIGDDSDGFDSNPSFNVGGVANIPFSSMFSFAPEISFSGEGAKQNFSGGDVKYNLYYINVPMLFKYHSNPSGGFYAELGPQIGFLTSAKAKGGGETEDIKDAFKSISFAVDGGVGYTLKSGFGFGARYALGLANIIDADESDLKTGVISVNVHYMFHSMKKK